MKIHFNTTEFIQTERNYLRTLLVLEKVYARGMCEELQMQHMIDNLFPNIKQHKKFVKAFVKTLDERQKENIVSVDVIIRSQFIIKQICFML